MLDSPSPHQAADPAVDRLASVIVEMIREAPAGDGRATWARIDLAVRRAVEFFQANPDPLAMTDPSPV